MADPIELTITRGWVDREAIFGIRRKADDSFDFMLDHRSKIGYVRLAAFQRLTMRNFKQALTELERQKIRGLVLDLRFNSGGSLTTFVEIGELFVGEGTLLTIKSRQEPILYVATKKNPPDFPLVCLVNGETASTSECMAACFQDHGRAVIVGERTRGETGIRLGSYLGDGELRFTSALLCRPSGKNLTKMMTAGKATDDWPRQS